VTKKEVIQFVTPNAIKEHFSLEELFKKYDSIKDVQSFVKKEFESRRKAIV